MHDISGRRPAATSPSFPERTEFLRRMEHGYPRRLVRFQTMFLKLEKLPGPGAALLAACTGLVAASACTDESAAQNVGTAQLPALLVKRREAPRALQQAATPPAVSLLLRGWGAPQWVAAAPFLAVCLSVGSGASIRQESAAVMSSIRGRVQSSRRPSSGKTWISQLSPPSRHVVCARPLQRAASRRVPSPLVAFPRLNPLTKCHMNPRDDLFSGVSSDG